MTFDEWFEGFCRSQGGGYHWQVELVQMKESFHEAWKAGKEVGYNECYDNYNLPYLGSKP